MQEYGQIFAKAYNQKWSGFANRLAPKLLQFCQNHFPNKPAKILDLCCGTGQIALYFLQHGYEIIGLDASQPMLDYAKQNCALYVAGKKATFQQADAADFELDEKVDFAISTFDSLNHLANEEELQNCFHSVFHSLNENGIFIFDLNTRKGLQRWNGISIEDDAEITLINRGLLIEQENIAYVKISGFIRNENGAYHRFDETFFNRIFPLQQVETMLKKSGFDSIYFALGVQLEIPVTDPESHSRIFIVAQKK